MDILKGAKNAFVAKAMSIPKPISDEKWEAINGKMQSTMAKLPGDKIISKFDKVISSIPAPKWMHRIEAKYEQMKKDRNG